MKRMPTTKQLEVERQELVGAFASARKDAGLTRLEVVGMTKLGLQTLIRIEAGGAGTGLANMQVALAAVGLKLKAVPRD